MSKKMKPNRLFDETAKKSNIELVNEAKKEKSAEDEVIDAIGAEENPVVGLGRMSSADAEKLAKYDAMEKSLASMSAEKDALEAKIAEYIEKIDSFKNADDEIRTLHDRCKELEEKCKNNEKCIADAADLKKQVENLQNENDQYLIKISELTFENANLASQLSELERRAKSNGNVANQNSFKPVNGPQPQMSRNLASPMKDAYNPYANNGYGSW